MEETTQALQDFTARYCALWQQECGHLPASEALYGIASPCVAETLSGVIYWQPQPFTLAKNLAAVERALDLRLQPAVIDFYTTQFAADMSARIGGRELSLVQVWSEEDFVRVQENLIGHLVMKRRLKHSPTLFIATTESELEVVSLCNISGEVILEQLGTQKRDVLASSLPEFLTLIQAVR
ncbi:SecY interacting protein Syd [Erwinia toletana]|uniref:Protein Syd n=1 Tax=Winslowiella toletana TaxID=92490 RepID=A0ABS4P619_9GAMM|nr:SecY-interacting protein [Winslowiella toletana]MBP2168083.1 SecY interacting protein Syd [Winslowiella toletana]